MQERKGHRCPAAAVLVSLVACTSVPTDASDVWFVSTHGQVTLEDGSPVANAFVHAMWFGDHECDAGLIDDETTRTDAEGRYAILLEGREREGCLGLTVTPNPGSGLSSSWTAVQVADLQSTDFESTFTLEWVIPSSGGVSRYGAP